MNLESPNLLKMLASTRLAEGLTHHELERLGRTARLLEVPAGHILFGEGQREDDLFVVFTGHVRISMMVPGRGDVTILTAGPGDLVGWSGCISDGFMTATATTTDVGRLIALSGRQLKQACDEDPQLGYILMKRLAQVISRKLTSTRIQLLDLFSRQDGIQ